MKGGKHDAVLNKQRGLVLLCSFHKTIQEFLLLFKIGPSLPEISNSQVFSGARACVRGGNSYFHRSRSFAPISNIQHS